MGNERSWIRDVVPVLGLLAGIALATVAIAAGPREWTEQPAAWGNGADAEIEELLLRGEIVEARDLGTGVTRPVKVRLRLGERTLEAIWKGIDQEYARTPTGSRRRDDLYFSDRWQHEVAAYRIDRLIGLGRVPPTVIRPLEGRPGALQAWVEGVFTERDRVEQGVELADPGQFQRDRQLLALFDALIYNVDRTQENILIGKRDGAITLIDHSRAFRLRPQLPSKDSIPAASLPADLRTGLRQLDLQRLTDAAGGLLTRGQLRAILKRRDRLEKGWAAAR